MWYNFKFEGVLFRSDFRHNDRVDSLVECVTKQAVITVAQWHRNQIIRSLWSLAQKEKLKMDSCLRWCNFKFDDILFNLDTYRRMQQHKITLRTLYNTIQYNKLYLKSENIKHYNTSSNELLNPTYSSSPCICREASI